MMIYYFLAFFIVLNSFNHAIYGAKSYQINKINEIKKKNQFERIASLNRADEIYRAEELLRKQEEEEDEEIRRKHNQHSPSKSFQKSFFDTFLMSWIGRKHKRFIEGKN